MALPKNGGNSSSTKKKVSYISVPSQIINSLSSSSLQSLLVSPKKSSRCTNRFSYRNPRIWFLTLFLVSLFGMLKLGLNVDPISLPFSRYPCSTGSFDEHHAVSHLAFASKNDTQSSSSSEHRKNETLPTEGDFWKQPDGLGFKPCLGFSRQYRKDSNSILKNRWKYLLVVVAGGMNQQRNQIVDAVIMARILGASLVVPVLQVNVIWGDESEFADIFDLEHFKNVLADDVHIVSSLPSTHVMTRPVEEKRTPLHASPQWIRAHYLKRINRERVLLLRGLDSRLSNDLPSDLQKLRCKVAFQALRFSPRILELGNKLASRMLSEGQYLSLHLRMEKDVWVRTGCLPGLTPEKLAGLCPLTALEVTRLLKALEAPKDARIYWAGGEPLGGKEALEPLTKEFPHLYNKHDLALPGELEPFAKKASVMAAIDYIVCEKSDVFIPSHGGNMGHALQGQRAYAGHKKYITPNKRHMLPYFMNASLPESEFNRIVKDFHRESLGQPELRTGRGGKDVTKHPVSECMCSDRRQQQQ
ncbi:BnaC04g03810D [Brassica napus]|uniref:O-fucosyltransferase family protein n=1 Tax=Brassica napus TaxID=3708 RepID=A0A078IET7_BRANA|nr:BnaC04g03810D [Brassica napus]